MKNSNQANSRNNVSSIGSLGRAGVGLLLHYLKIAFRNLWKHKTQSFTGIFGLAFGLACFIPALYWMRYETTYDSFYPNAKNIYRIYTVEKQSGKVIERAPGILKRKLQEHFPEIESSTHLVLTPMDYLTEETPYISLRTIFADSTFFKVFPQVVVSGDAQHPLQIEHNIVLTESVAVRLFGDAEKAIGQYLRNAFIPPDRIPPYTVTAVIKDPPPNSNLQFDVIHYWQGVVNTFDNLPETEQWTYFEYDLYTKFHPRADAAALAEQLRDFTSRIKANADIEVRMIPIGDVRHQFNTDLPFTLNFVRLFVVAGLLLLFSAFFNFLNLYLDLFRQRIRELHLRTVHGAAGGQLIAQLMFELTCTILLSLALAWCFILLTRPGFSVLLDITLEIPQLIYLFVVCGISVTVLMLSAAFIPLWRLSRSASHDLAKGKSRQPVLRRVAVTVQLAVSVVFIVAALVVMMQMRFVNHKDLGFNSSGLIQISGPEYPMIVHGKALSQELAAIPQIEKFTATTFAPQHNIPFIFMRTEVEWPGKQANTKPAFMPINADSRFAETFGLKMLMGKWWNEGDRQKVVLNEEAVRVMELSDPVGTTIRLSSEYNEGISPLLEYEVVGVVNDFHTLSLRSPIYPTIFISKQQLMGYIIRVVPGREQETIQHITDILPGINASLADVRLTPLDDLYDRLNRSEQAGLKLFSVMATVCLLISLFGIYAVATAAANRRRKEIAIRKVAGAEVSNIIHMFFREYSLQVIIAGIIALPLAYYAMNRWLQGYAYHTNIPWWLLTGVMVAVVVMVLLTVLGQVMKAANQNPAEVVKTE